jgi:DNA-binding transcriptional ArsR family regulator
VADRLFVERSAAATVSGVIVVAVAPSGRDNVVHPSWLDVFADPVRLAILANLAAAPMSARELAAAVHISDGALRRHLEALLAAGIVCEFSGRSDGLTTGRPAAHFAIDPAVQESLKPLFRALREPLRAVPR